jgi:hypothetical protein
LPHGAAACDWTEGWRIGKGGERESGQLHGFHSLKGPKHEIFESRFFTEIRPVRIGDLGTGEKKNEFSLVGVFIIRFSQRISY